MNKEKLLLVKLKPSCSKVLLVLCPHLLVMLFIVYVFLVNGLDILLLVLCLIFITISLSYYYILYIKLNAKNSIQFISKDKANNFVIKGTNSANHAVKLSGSSFSNDFFIILNVYDAQNRIFTALISKGCIDSETYRKLKVAVNTLKLSD